MLPTQPSNHWWGHHHVDYQHRFGWPAPPPAAEAGAAATGGVEGAAAAAAAGAGGVPPRGPWGYHHYYDGYGRYGRRWGRRPGGRLSFLLIGIGGTAWYFKSKEYRREYERRMIEGSSPSSPSQGTGPSGWGGHCRWSQQRYQPPSPPPVDHTTYTNIDQPTIPTSFPSQPQEGEDTNNRPAWGWKNWKERKAAREEAWKAAREKYFQRLEGGPQAVQSVPSEKATTQDPEVPYTVSTQSQGGEELGDMKRLREIVEKLWEERKGEKVGEGSANDKAKEYAREKLDKLSAALDTLRESLKKDAESKTKEADRKWV